MFPVLKRQKTFFSPPELENDDMKDYDPPRAFVPEWKYIDTFGSGQIIFSDGNAQLGGKAPAQGSLNAVSVGTSSMNRTGRKITIKSIVVKGVCRIQVGNPNNIPAYTEAPLEPLFFVSLVLDKRCNGSIALSDEVYFNVSGQNALCAFPWMKLENESRFEEFESVLLVSKPTNSVFFSGTGDTYGNGQDLPFEFNFDGLDIPVLYNDEGGDVTSIVDNSFNVYAWANTGANEQLNTMFWTARVRFVG